MFRKIVSQLSFSPALVGQLGFYARRLKKEQATRKLGLIFVALALVVQSLVVFQAPEPANASNPSDFIPGGLGLGANRSLNKFLGPYDQNQRHLKDVMNYFGITREEIASSQFTNWQAQNKISYGFYSRAGTKAIDITDANYKSVTTIYGRPMTTFAAPTERIWGWVGYSKVQGWFAIMQACGNLVTEHYPEKPTPPKPANIVADKTAVNVSQGNIDATKNKAIANDTITYTVEATNNGGTAKLVELKDNLRNVLGYSTLIDRGGGTFDSDTMNLTWPSTNLAPGQSITHKYTIKMNSSLISKTENCNMDNAFLGKDITIPVGCSTPPAKIVVTKNAMNITQGNIDATKTTAKAKDRITFTLHVSNTGGTAANFSFEDNLSDALEYATLVDNGGGTYSESSHTLSWPSVILNPSDEQVRSFSMQLLGEIPATPNGLSDPSSYDCKIENTFYSSSVVIPVDCSTPPKVIEHVVKELPKTGPGENVLFAGIVLAVVVFFYLRSRQLGSEVRLIRRDLNGGTI